MQDGGGREGIKGEEGQKECPLPCGELRQCSQLHWH